jgi:hypothetical protein
MFATRDQATFELGFTNTEILANKSCRILKHREQILLRNFFPYINVAKESEKKLKYRILTNETQYMCDMKCYIIPVVIGVREAASKCLFSYLESILGRHRVGSLQNAASLGTVLHSG